MTTNNIYLLLAGQLTLYDRVAIEANNMANASALGFQERYLLIQKKNQSVKPMEKLTFPDDVSSPRSARPGPLSPTYQALDVAINGAGFFKIQTPLGIRYTRAGNFRNNLGTLSTQDGYPVLDASDSTIALPAEMNALGIDGAGTITNGVDVLTTLGIVDFAKESDLESVGGGLLKANADPIEASGYTILQGMLEQGNVQTVLKMEDIMQLQRNFNGLTETVIAHYKLLETTLTTLAKVKA